MVTETRKYQFICGWCSESFAASKPDAKTCSDKCRQNLHRYGCLCGGVFIPYKQSKVGKTFYMVRKCTDCGNLMGGKKKDML